MAHQTNAAVGTLTLTAQLTAHTTSHTAPRQRNEGWSGVEQVHDPSVLRETEDRKTNQWRDNDGGYMPTMAYEGIG
jgi:hypothetical protein